MTRICDGRLRVALARNTVGPTPILHRQSSIDHSQSFVPSSSAAHDGASIRRILGRGSPTRETPRLVTLRTADQIPVHNRRHPLGVVGTTTATSARRKKKSGFVRRASEAFDRGKRSAPAIQVERRQHYVQAQVAENGQHVVERLVEEMGLVDGYESRLRRQPIEDFTGGGNRHGGHRLPVVGHDFVCAVSLIDKGLDGQRARRIARCQPSQECRRFPTEHATADQGGDAV